MLNRKICIFLLLSGIILLACSIVHAKKPSRRHSSPPDVHVYSGSKAYADDGKYFYGGSKKGRYGERRSVTNEDEARGIMREYYPNKGTKIGKVKKKKFYFEADILDEHGDVIDRVIIDKRTGRIRSVY